MLKTTDNNCGNCQVSQQDLENFQKISNTKIKDITIGNNSNLLIYPQSFSDCEDRIYDETIFSLQGQKLTTGNVMGFVGINESELTIQSRFVKDEHDYFLHYLLQKVFSFNLFELKHRSNKENIFDFLIYLFSFFLKKALGQGLFKEYQKKSYNDANVRGNIDINSYIRNNIPFNGKIAYRVREHSYDNKITQLVRHTIEFIKRHRFANGVLTSSNDIQSCVLQIVQATPTYDYNSRKSVINLNLRPLVHPYFSEYKDLQKICLQILRFEGLKFGEKDDKIYGLLFDGAWLWEEYLNTVLKDCNFIHPMNKASKGAIYLFAEPKGYKRYPDFWKNNFIIDAKYKNQSDSIDRNDMNQIISYMYVMQADLGGFLYPTKHKDKLECKHIGKLNGFGGLVKTWSIPIPQKADSFDNFSLLMAENENELKAMIMNEKAHSGNIVYSAFGG